LPELPKVHAGPARCANCDELVVDYEADNQINRAFEQQIRALGNGDAPPPERHGADVGKS
jgi:hypothetical protein